MLGGDEVEVVALPNSLDFSLQKRSELRSFLELFDHLEILRQISLRIRRDLPAIEGSGALEALIDRPLARKTLPYGTRSDIV